MSTKKKTHKTSSSDSILAPHELNHICDVIAREKKFNEEDLATQGYEGQLSKYTNVMKGWQYRYFVINPSRLELEYYMVEEKKNSTPRGCMSLVGAQILPSEEDSQTFTIISTCGEIYKLKAIDAKDRQKWVNKLRSTIQIYENYCNNPTDKLSMIKATNQSEHISQQNSKQILQNSPFDTNLLQSLDSVSKQLLITEQAHLNLVESINNLKSSDALLLQMKANSCAALLSLHDSLDILRMMH